MEIIVIALAALFASGLTLFSGFGLGTLLMPVAALFFPVDIAIGITAVVHLANNIFKLGLLGARADMAVVARFGVPAVIAAFLGAFLLSWLTVLPPVMDYMLAHKHFQITPVKFVIGLLILFFVLLELLPGFAEKKLDGKFLPIGGIVSGFFGGLSGHQGAFRSMFLIKAGLSKQQFIATSVVLAVMVDMARLLVYGTEASIVGANVDWPLVAVATVAAFMGAFVGSRLIHKMTIRSIQWLVTLLLFIVALGLMAGFV